MNNTNDCTMAAAEVIPLRAEIAECVNTDAALATLKEACDSLKIDGHRIAAITANAEHSRPTIWLFSSKRLTQLAQIGAASYDALGTDTAGGFRVGRFMRAGALVQWFERVPS